MSEQGRWEAMADLAWAAQLDEARARLPWEKAPCVCGARQGDSEIMCFEYVGTRGDMKLIRVQQGGTTLWEAP